MKKRKVGEATILELNSEEVDKLLHGFNLQIGSHVILNAKGYLDDLSQLENTYYKDE